MIREKVKVGMPEEQSMVREERERGAEGGKNKGRKQEWKSRTESKKKKLRVSRSKERRKTKKEMDDMWVKEV